MARGDRWAGDLLDWAVAQEPGARLQLFRFVDVLPALAGDRALLDHLEAYFGAAGGPFGRLARAGLRIAGVGRLGEVAVARVAREAVRQLARRFIAGETVEEALQAVAGARKAHQGFTFDLLGEACLSEAEARTHQQRYQELLERLVAEAARWPADPRVDHAPWGAVPRVNLSVKLSALHPFPDPIDPRASARELKERLRPLLRAAQAAGAHLHLDMEERQLKDLTLETFTELCEEEEFRGNRHVGVVLQAYLIETRADARDLVAWARRRGTPVTVRLVKGAYWDHEVARARLEGWPVPVYQQKAETDASFEELTAFFLEHAGTVDLAVASHNVRSVARALALREELGLPPGSLEVQVLFGMGAPLAAALAKRGERVRVYMPVGELIPGMAYLVRRLLENTANESFLRRSFMGGEPADRLLAPPAPASPPAAGASHLPATPLRPDAGPVDRSPGFANEPLTDFSRREERERFAEALRRVRSEFGRDYPLILGGAPVATRETLVSVNPSRPQEVVGRVSAASAADVHRAVAAAERAFPGWRSTPPEERARLLQRAAALLRARRAELAAWILYETGKPWREADADVAEAIDFVNYYTRQAVELLPPRRLGDRPGEVNWYLREPVGVAAVIAPWNFPLAILTGMASAALAAGNTVVLKPAEQSPVVAAKLVEILHEAGLPPGVVNYLPGRGEVAGEELVRHPGVRLVVFTGSKAVGTHIVATAARLAPGARYLKRVVAEMGGKNAILVDDDADLDEAVAGIVASAFGYAGQKCSACSRVIAVGPIQERLVERLVEATRSVPWGPADDPRVVVGPLIDEEARDRVARYVELGRREARPALIRELPPALAELGGYYAPPAIFTAVDPASPLAREEIFGPVLAVLAARSFREGLELAMDSEYALTGGVYSRNPRHLREAREAFRVGNLYLNRGITGAKVGRQPFGGRRLSGVGHQSGGPDYLLQFVESRVVTENTLRRGFVSSLGVE